MGNGDGGQGDWIEVDQSDISINFNGYEVCSLTVIARKFEVTTNEGRE